MINKDVFKDVSYGMYLVTTKKDIPCGCIINTLTQITSSTPLVSISLNKNNYTTSIIKETKKFAVSILTEETSKELIKTFGYFSSKDINKFENIKYEEVSKQPIIKENISSYLICDVENIVDCDTHYIFIGRVNQAEKISDNKPMTYKYYQEELKGTSPKNAPTYIETKLDNSYRCTICGYIYDNSKEKIRFEDLPADWKCPICGVGKEMFEKVTN